MTASQAFEIAQAVLLALGGGAALVFALSNWLGKVWANRLMASEKARFEREIEQLKAALQQQIDRSAYTYRQKIDLYKEVSGPIIKLIVNVEHNAGTKPADFMAFDNERLQATALLGMFAPQPVFDSYNTVIDYIYDSFEGKEKYSFQKFRELALKFLSEVRKDIGLYNDEITYKGTR